MSLAEILPSLQELSREEKIQLLKMLVDDIGESDLRLQIEEGREYPIWSPIEAHEAAAQLLAALEADKGRLS